MKRPFWLGLGMLLLVGGILVFNYQSPGRPQTTEPTTTSVLEALEQKLASVEMPTPRTADPCPPETNQQPLSAYDSLVLRRDDLPWEANGYTIDVDRSYTADTTDFATCQQGMLQRTTYMFMHPTASTGWIQMAIYAQPAFARDDYTKSKASQDDLIALETRIHKDPPGMSIDSTLGDARAIYHWSEGTTELISIHCRISLTINAPFDPPQVVAYAQHVFERLELRGCP